MNKSKVVVLLLVVLILISACGKEKYEPQPINPEVDICVVCKMAIKDDQYPTQIITKDGQSLKFDDLGDMNKWKEENGEDTIGASFVRDYHSLQWIRYEKAYYVYDSSIQTPMAYGIVSFEKEEDATNFIANHGSGQLMNAEQLNEHTWEVNHDMLMKHNHDHGHDHEHGTEDPGEHVHDDSQHYHSDEHQATEDSKHE